MPHCVKNGVNALPDARLYSEQAVEKGFSDWKIFFWRLVFSNRTGHTALLQF